MTIYAINPDGTIQGLYVGCEPPYGLSWTDVQPPDGAAIWDGKSWIGKSRLEVIDDRLRELDAQLPRLLEDVAKASGVKLFSVNAEVAGEKTLLRLERAELIKQENVNV